MLFNTNLIFGTQKPYNATMWYVEVIVADATYHRDEPLTYSAPEELEAGRIVIVPLRQKEVIGVVVATVRRPSFTVKPILEVTDLPPLPDKLIALLNWMRGYYPAPLGITAQLFLPKSLAKKSLEATTTATTRQPSLPPLTKDQKKAIEAASGPGLHVLHGETGTGKTRVYIELAKQSLKEGMSSIILTPEIGLTSQLAGAFRQVFNDQVTIVHSGMSDATRRQTWQKLLEQKQPAIVIGARSALFSPLADIGLLIVDEAHETAYKQDQAPYYHTTAVAAKLAILYQATLILGSATPLISDYYIASAKGRPIIRMTELATNNISPVDIDIVDLRDRTSFTKSAYISDRLMAALRERLAKKEQALLFLNRRGTARVVFCEQCGWQATCPHCDLPLVYHGDRHSMRCHSCGYKNPSPSSCPECQNPSIVFKSIGTKAIAEEVQRLFPEARIMRFDTDNKKHERLEVHYSAVRSGEVDVIVGTQTLAKGLDLPKLGLVGVIIADTSLYFHDFTAEERTYQLLSQVIGRVGRGHRHSHVIVQTYSPDSQLLAAVLTKNWGAFYNKELKERQQFLFPPFSYLLKLSCKRATSQAAQKAAETLAKKLGALFPMVVIEGPSPSFHEKQQNKYIWQLVIKAKKRGSLVDILKHLPSGWSYNIDPMNLL